MKATLESLHPSFTIIWEIVSSALREQASMGKATLERTRLPRKAILERDSSAYRWKMLLTESYIGRTPPDLTNYGGKHHVTVCSMTLISLATTSTAMAPSNVTVEWLFDLQ